MTTPPFSAQAAEERAREEISVRDAVKRVAALEKNIERLGVALYASMNETKHGFDIIIEQLNRIEAGVPNTKNAGGSTKICGAAHTTEREVCRCIIDWGHAGEHDQGSHGWPQEAP